MASAGRGRLLIAGVTTRAMAQSAAKAGFSVIAVDAFGDRDLETVANVIFAGGQPRQRYSALQAATLAAPVPADLVAYTSNFENYPSAVIQLSQGRELLGNAPDVLRRVRNPVELARALRRHGLACPLSRATPPAGNARSTRWLLKPRRSGGGHGIRPWRPGLPISRGTYLQQRIAGTPGSIILACTGRSAVVLGLTRQLVGERDLGARRFQYCGSLLLGWGSLFGDQPELVQHSADLARVVAREFRLVGLNGIDFIAHGGIPYPTEVNPRFSASMELVERAQGISMFDVHFRCCRGSLPAVGRPVPGTHGKAIVFARRSVTIPASSMWDAGDIADLPHPGERIERGHPICTVFARAAAPGRCRHRLLRRAAAVYRCTERAARRAS